MTPLRILARCPNPVGDAVMVTPALRALRRAHPEARIALLGPQSHGGLLRGVASFDEFISLEGPGLRKRLAQLRALRRDRFDWAVLFPDSARVAIEAALAGIPRRAGYARDPVRRVLLTDALEAPREGGRRMPLSMIERYLRVTRRLGCADAGSELELAVDAIASERVAERLRAHGVGADEPLLLVTPGAGFGGSKRWPPAHFARAADEIRRRFGLLPVVLGGPGEEAVAREVVGAARERRVALVDGRGTLEDLKALVARSTLVLSNDTGPRHVAVALGRPVIVLMGPTDPRHTAHLLERQRVLREDVACSPCGRKVCPIDHRCMTHLGPERAVQAAAELLVRDPG